MSATRTRRRRAHRPGPDWIDRRARRAVVGLLTASLAVLAGCGVPTQSGPHALSASQIPPGLSNNQPPTTPPTTAPKYKQPVQIYFTRTNNKYVAPVSPQKDVPPPVTLMSILEVLVTTGPSTVDIGNGYQSALTRTVKVLGATVKGSVATVDFNQTFGLISGTRGALAVAQVVYTVTANEATVTQVAFEIEGQPTEVPNATGALAPPGPVTAADYASLLQPPGAPTTVPPATTTAPAG